jgi:GNAT superfamily N-acetyltransferase
MTADAGHPARRDVVGPLLSEADGAMKLGRIDEGQGNAEAGESIAIRDARPGEADAVAVLHEASATLAYAHIFPPSAPFPREETLQRWRTFAGRILVAESANAGALVGFAAFDEQELHALYVAPAHWGLGLGARLLAAAGPVRVLWVLRENTRGRRFYERHGWCPDGAEREAYGVVEVRYRQNPAMPAP